MDDSPGIHLRLRRYAIGRKEQSAATHDAHADKTCLELRPLWQPRRPGGVDQARTTRELAESGDDPRQYRGRVVHGPPLFAGFISRDPSLAAAPEAKMRDLPRTMGRHVEVAGQPANNQWLNHHDLEGSSSAHAHRCFVCLRAFSNAPKLACVSELWRTCAP